MSTLYFPAQQALNPQEKAHVKCHLLGEAFLDIFFSLLAETITYVSPYLPVSWVSVPLTECKSPVDHFDVISYVYPQQHLIHNSL